MKSTKLEDKPWPYTRLSAALLFSILLFIPIVLAGLPVIPKEALPIALTRTDAVLIFFIGTPIVFTIFAAYRLVQFYGIIGES